MQTDMTKLIVAFHSFAKSPKKKAKGSKHVDLEEALAIWAEQFNAKDSTATDKVLKERTNMMCKYCTLLLH